MNEKRQICGPVLLWQFPPRTTRMSNAAGVFDCGVMKRKDAETFARERGLQFCELSATTGPVLVFQSMDPAQAGA